MSYVTGISGNVISAASAGYAPTNSADVSAIASAYATGKQDTLSFSYDDDKISAINGSALAGGGGVTGDYVDKSAMEVAIGSGNDVSATSFAFGVDNSANSAGVAFGRSNYASASSLAVGNGNKASSRSFAFGSNSTAGTRSMAFGSNASANEGSLAFGSTCKASMDSYVFGSHPTATDYSFAFGNHSIATNTSVAEGYYVSANSGAVAFGKYNLHGNGHTGSGDSAAFVIGDGTGSTARHDLMLVTKDGEITMYSSTADTAGTGIMSSIRAISAAATGGVDEATVSAIASAYADPKQDTLSFSYDDGKISAINGSALAGQGGGGLVTAIGTSESGITSINNTGIIDTAALRSADYSSLYVQEPLYISASGDSSYIGISGDVGGVDSATCSAIASAYAESAVSAVSGDYYSTSNPSGFITSAPFDSATCSAIASSYAESAVSSVSGNYYTTANESGFLTGLPASISATRITVDSARVQRAFDVTGHARAYNSSDNKMYGNFDYAGMYFRSGDQRPYNIGIDSTGSNFFIATARNGFERIYASSIQSWNGKADSSAMSSYVPYSSLEYNTASAISGINGSALAAGSTYSAGEGIDITDDVISVETPVDIVAGPGIVIDNPDGNTLRVSTDENYETVLWEGTAATSVTCSEAITNFERLKVYVTPPAITMGTMNQIVEMVPGKFGSFMMLAGYQSKLFHIYGGHITNSGTTTLKTENVFHMWVPITAGGSVGNESSNSKITKVVGIHRINGGN